MAQLRQDYPRFVERQAEVLVIGPDSPAAFRDYWQAERLPFPGLADPDHTVAKLYRQEVNLLRLGRMPAQLLVDKQGRIRYQHYGHSMADIAINAEVLTLLEQLNQEA